jgi:putative endonuclease
MPSSEDRRKRDRGRLIKGRHFENLAAEFYEQKGFRVLERNWRAGHKEIDLIVRKDNQVVFVEVKASFSEEYGHPAAWVDERKVRNLTEAARAYIQKAEITGCDLRFDVITFLNGQLEHYPDAFPAA